MKGLRTKAETNVSLCSSLIVLQEDAVGKSLKHLVATPAQTVALMNAN